MKVKSVEKKELTLPESSNIARAEYDSKLHILYVTFHSGQTYSYDNVPESVVDDFEKAESAGKFFCKNIKWKYTYRKER